MSGTHQEAEPSATAPLVDPVAEGKRIVTEAQRAGLVVRTLGGVAVAILCPSSREPPLARRYGDIDLATLGSSRDAVGELLTRIGYAADREFNALHGQRRLSFWDGGNRRQVDVFVDEAHLCHRIDLRGRLDVMALTIPPADLLLLKLQVVETSEKDLLDVCAILSDHDLTHDDSGVNRDRIAHLAASDWGLWKTLTIVAKRAEAFAAQLPGFAAKDRVGSRLELLLAALEAVPKSGGWKLRARIGERKRWYDLPEEAH